ncbi:SRPBCC family protein, partial [Pseudomonas aeruginosa]
LLGYLSYEIFHACEHLPPEHPLSRLPWIRHMRRLHELHHRRELMQTHNFNLVFPLMDWCYGTLHWEAETAEEHAMTRMQHRIEIAR